MDEPSSGQVKMLVMDVKDRSVEAGDNQLERGIGEHGVLCRAAGYAEPCPGGCPGLMMTPQAAA
jgi:hypothetical protein